MGSIFSERVLGIANPRVALLSIGEEKGKATSGSSRPRNCSTGPT
jgi:fatty acid/phospholipid biosynthesis enzyme